MNWLDAQHQKQEKIEGSRPLGENKGDAAAICRRYELVAALDEAAALIEHEPDAAALLLDGALQRIVAEWFALQGRNSPPAPEMFVALEQEAPVVSWRLRLALHAPDARARLLHCWALIEAIRAAIDDTTFLFFYPDSAPFAELAQLSR